MSINHNLPVLLDINSTLFPPTSMALIEPNGLLAFGGDLSMERLISAYQHGVFPWYSDGEPIMWWSPTPRSVIFVNQYKAAKSLKKLSRKNLFELKHNMAFNEVIRSCANINRKEQNGTWITEEMILAYEQLHQLGVAHSFECWQENHLVGGLYGIIIDKVFFGESMFSNVSNSSKLAFMYSVEYCQQQGIELIDCQVESDHMNSLGAINISRNEFEKLLKELINK
ncbi:MAG: leucyl/phenylalanyl-tRNA--protein transferase [Gammaproteobacteria bacterium]|nr:leucyl/phenylalanyl-tRNA--protein transferase [Gammaproteobacteria bacterium]